MSTGGFSFGGSSTPAFGGSSGTGFSFGASAANPASGAQQQTGISFGVSSSPSAGFSLGGTAASSGPAFGAMSGGATSFSFGGASSAGSSGGFSFGGASVSGASTPAAASTAGFSFGGASSASFGGTTASAASTPAAASSAGFSFGGASSGGQLTQVSAPAPSSTPAAVTTTVANVTTPSTIKGQVVENIIKEWTDELEKRSRAFVKHAEELSKWDQSILENRQALIQLEGELKRVLAGQDALERRLQMVEAHQKGIHEALNGMSTEAERLYREEQGLADDQALERDALYERTSRLGVTLNQIGEQLGDAIQDVNSVTAASLGDAGSVSKLVRVLNNQLNALIQLEGKTSEVQQELNKL